jgi:hypothetical protein
MASTIINGEKRGKISALIVMVDIHVQEGILVVVNYAHMDIIVSVE